MNTNETERDTPYDRACRDPRDNCPTEGAVLKREWRQKTVTIAILSATVEQQAVKYERLRATAAALLEDMGTPIDGIEATLLGAKDARMKDAILIELAARWDRDAIAPQRESGYEDAKIGNAVSKGERQAKRECADTIRTLVQMLGGEHA